MPYYDLDKDRKAAQRLDIEYRGWKVRLDIANLGYELNDVADCIERLTAKNYYKTLTYKDGQIDDVYKCIYQKDNEDEVFKDELYIKLSLYDDCLSISLGSFHL